MISSSLHEYPQSLVEFCRWSNSITVLHAMHCGVEVYCGGDVHTTKLVFRGCRHTSTVHVYLRITWQLRFHSATYFNTIYNRAFTLSQVIFCRFKLSNLEIPIESFNYIKHVQWFLKPIKYITRPKLLGTLVKHSIP